MGRPLLELSYAYASAVDGHHGTAVAGLFTPTGRLIVHRPEAGPPMEHTGPAAIARVIDALARYDRTEHLVVDHRSRVEGDTAVGWTDCVAHHVGGEAGDGIDRVVHIRYEDRYNLVGGEWRFAERHVRMEREDFLPVH